MSITDFFDDELNSVNPTFVSRMSQCRQTVCALEESLDYDRDGLNKMKKALKTIYNGGNAHVDNEVYLSKVLERLGANAMTKDQEPDIGAAFIKFSIVTKELSALMKTLMQSLNNVVMFPLDNILKGDLKGVKGDLKKPFDKAWRDFESKLSKVEKEKRQQAKDCGVSRSDVSAAEIAEEIDKEKKYLQLQMCEYLLKANDIKTKKGVDLLQHLVDYYHAQTSYFQDGLKTIEHFNGYIAELSSKLQQIRAKQDDERKKLLDLRSVLRSSAPFLDPKESTSTLPPEIDSKKKGVYHLHQLEGNKHYGCHKCGYLLKKSEGKMRMKVWQKRKCEIEDGFLLISHSDETKEPTRVNLLTCQVKRTPDEKKSFDLVSCNRTYHFQTEDESDTEAWISVLINSKESALKKEFDSNIDYDSRTTSAIGTSLDGPFSGLSLLELRQSILRQVIKLPGNDKCVDCNSTKDPTWLSTNFGVLVCIECSGIHREMGVHVSRIQSLTLDNIGTSQLLLARVMSNHSFNDIVEATLRPNQKPSPSASMETRYEYIRAKYIDRKFVLRTCNGDVNDLKNDLEHAIQSRQIFTLLQAFAEGADLAWPLPSYSLGETALHVAICQEDGTSLHIVDFLVQNASPELLDKPTKDASTPLHWCVEYNQPECAKLLLRSGANVRKTNNRGQTPLDTAKELGRENIVELLEHALQNKKSLFENVNIDWNVNSAEDASTDFSDDEIVDDRGTLVNTSDRQTIGSRPSSVVECESPSSRSSEAFRSRDGHNQSIRRVSTGSTTVQSMGRSSFKKKVTTPSPPKGRDHLTSSESTLYTHIKTPSDSAPVYAQIVSRASGHWRNRSFDQQQSSSHHNSPFTSNGSGDHVKPVPAPKINLNSNSTSVKQTPPPLFTSSANRPRFPPPPLPPHQTKTTPLRTNGQVIDAIGCLSSDLDHDALRSSIPVPIPPPRKYYFQRPDLPPMGGKMKRCRALYDCEADREDELSFKEGEVILIINERTEDEDWMEGIIEGDIKRRGLFPASFVQLLPD